MGERGVPYVAAVGRSGPAFGMAERLRLRRAQFELMDGTGGVRSAVVELGGLPDEGPGSRGQVTGDGPDVGVVEPPAYRGRGRARVPGSTRDPRHQLARACRLRALALPRVGFVWERERRWAFDLAWPAPRVAVVIDGNCRLGGRDVPGAGWIRDAARLNLAAIEGWMVLRVTPAQIADGLAVQLVARALASPWRRL